MSLSLSRPYPLSTHISVVLILFSSFPASASPLFPLSSSPLLLHFLFLSLSPPPFSLALSSHLFSPSRGYPCKLNIYEIPIREARTQPSREETNTQLPSLALSLILHPHTHPHTCPILTLFLTKVYPHTFPHKGLSSHLLTNAISSHSISQRPYPHTRPHTCSIVTLFLTKALSSHSSLYIL